jgi:hypothetical protein
VIIVVAGLTPACRKPLVPPRVLVLDAATVEDARTSNVPAPDGLPPPSVEAPDGRPEDRPDDRPVDARNPDTGLACGAPGQSCCPGNRCGTGCCVGATCVALLESCPEASAVCRTTTCGGVCGGLRELCCGDAGYCVRELTVCQRTDGGARCEACGNTGEACCAGNHCEPPNRRCVNNRCATM